MLKKGMILSVVAGIALVSWCAFNVANASVCFLPDGNCSTDNTSSLADGDNPWGKVNPNPKPNNCSGSTTKPTPKDCYDCDSCVNDAGQTLYKNCYIKNGYEVVGNQCVKKDTCGSEFNLTEVKNANCWDCTPCTSNGVTKYKCEPKTNMGDYAIIGGECKDDKCPEGYSKNSPNCDRNKEYYNTEVTAAGTTCYSTCYKKYTCPDGSSTSPTCEAGQVKVFYSYGQYGSLLDTEMRCYKCENKELPTCTLNKGEAIVTENVADYNGKGFCHCSSCLDGGKAKWRCPLVYYPYPSEDKEAPVLGSWKHVDNCYNSLEECQAMAKLKQLLTKEKVYCYNTREGWDGRAYDNGKPSESDTLHIGSCWTFTSSNNANAVSVNNNYTTVYDTFCENIHRDCKKAGYDLSMEDINEYRRMTGKNDNELVHLNLGCVDSNLDLNMSFNLNEIYERDAFGSSTDGGYDYSGNLFKQCSLDRDQACTKCEDMLWKTQKIKVTIHLYSMYVALDSSVSSRYNVSSAKVTTYFLEASSPVFDTIELKGMVRNTYNGIGFGCNGESACKATLVTLHSGTKHWNHIGNYDGYYSSESKQRYTGLVTYIGRRNRETVDVPCGGAGGAPRIESLELYVGGKEVPLPNWDTNGNLNLTRYECGNWYDTQTVSYTTKDGITYEFNFASDCGETVY